MRREPKNLQISFKGNRLTHFGIVHLLYSFFMIIQLKIKVGRYIFSTNAQFNIAAKAFKPIERKLPSLRYTNHTSGAGSADLYYQSYGWNKKYRFIAIRRPLPEEHTSQHSMQCSIENITYYNSINRMQNIRCNRI